MAIHSILAELNKEIAKLEEVRTLLSGEPAAKRKPGRPSGTTNKEKPATKKRNLTPEGRKRIAEAVKKRWAKQKKAAAK